MIGISDLTDLTHLLVDDNELTYISPVPILTRSSSKIPGTKFH